MLLTRTDILLRVLLVRELGCTSLFCSLSLLPFRLSSALPSSLPLLHPPNMLSPSLMAIAWLFYPLLPLLGFFAYTRSLFSEENSFQCVYRDVCMYFLLAIWCGLIVSVIKVGHRIAFRSEQRFEEGYCCVNSLYFILLTRILTRKKSSEREKALVPMR